MEQIQLDISPKDTSKVQLSSVVLFMEQLGYTYLMPTKSFESGLWINRGRQYISLNTAVSLHNGLYNENHQRYFDPPFDNIPNDWFFAAQRNKIVQTVSLQNSRKKGIIVQKLWIRFAPTENGELFYKTLIK